MRILCVLVLTVIADLLSGDPVAAQTDLAGDPLPEGVLARMGSARFRHAGLSDYALLPDGGTVITAGSDHLLRFWDVGTGKPLRAVLLEGAPDRTSPDCLSSNGKVLLARIGNQFIVWDVESGRKSKALTGPANVQYGFVGLSPDGKTLAAITSKWQVLLIDIPTGAVREIKLPANRDANMAVLDASAHGTFSPDGRWYVASAGRTQPLGIFDAATGRELRRLECSAITSRISPDSKRLAVWSEQNDKREQAAVVRVFELASGKQIAQYPLGANDRFVALNFSPNGQLLACGGAGLICVLDLTSGQVLHRLPGPFAAPRFTREGRVLIASTGNRLRLWDVATGKDMNGRLGDFSYYASIAVSPDGRLLASGDWADQGVSLWDTASGRLLRQLPVSKDGYDIRKVAFLPDGKTVVACQSTGSLLFWDTATGGLRRTLRLVKSKNESVEFQDFRVSPDGKRVSALYRVFTRLGATTRLAAWDIAAAKLTTLAVQTHDPTFLHIGWLASGRLAVLPQGDHMSMTDVVSGVELYRFASAARDTPLAVSPDGRLVAGKIPLTAGVKSDPRAVVWETATGKEVATVTTGGFGKFAVAPDNRCLVTTEYGVVLVRDMATGTVRLRRPMPASERRNTARTYFYALALSPDGRRAFTVQADGTALVWDLTPALRPAEPLVKDAGAAEVARWWNDLGGEDATKAQRAVWSLVDAPKAALPFLPERMKPVARPDAKQVRRWIAALDSDDFDARQRAQQELTRIADRIEPAIRETLKGSVAIEARRRLETLLKGRHGIPPLEELRVMRAIEVLELIGTKESLVVLRVLADGAPGARLTREAQASVERLAARTPSR